jgi:hypothetical protein
VSVYVLMGEGLSATQVSALTDAVANGGGRLAVVMSSRLLVIEPGPSTLTNLQALPGDVVLAIGEDDVAALQAVSVPPDVLADVTLLAGTTSAATTDADAARTGQGQYWPGIGCLVEED